MISKKEAIDIVFNVKQYFGVERKDKHPIFLANIDRLKLLEQFINQAPTSDEIKYPRRNSKTLEMWANIDSQIREEKFPILYLCKPTPAVIISQSEYKKLKELEVK